jgi:hypothetical protein
LKDENYSKFIADQPLPIYEDQFTYCFEKIIMQWFDRMTILVIAVQVGDIISMGKLEMPLSVG